MLAKRDLGESDDCWKPGTRIGNGMNRGGGLHGKQYVNNNSKPPSGSPFGSSLLGNWWVRWGLPSCKCNTGRPAISTRALYRIVLPGERPRDAFRERMA
ncbi:hypothetical protein CTA1_3542 [Colletotrichum tanaceti]|uniref:Uncharacterized protein n=1 Tax=Colletotrichum tanaceti TaxID=1306861 RepID=A0A4U6XLU5_9PEZI|nr:hypothetical protein CTA1_3542 [Colletotrichum tanaceti]